jgi:hypothetical protein
VPENGKIETLTWFVLVTLITVSLFSHAQHYFPKNNQARVSTWGTFDHPFAATSPWNSRPLDPVFANAVIPAARHAPAIESGKWSTGVFEAVPETSFPVIVSGPGGKPGLWRVDDRTFGSVRVAHWPDGVIPAAGSDGHAEVVDTEAGVVHSFWKLRNHQGKWVAQQYAWTSLRGSGWGDPAHPMQGARAAGVPAIGGLIRTKEVNDGEHRYHHALSMSLPTKALSPSPAYVYPATSADTEAQLVNTGTIPQGALLMLPPGFDTTTIGDARIRKIAETLKVHGAYVVDRNDATGFVIYAEIGSGLELHERFWNGTAVADLEKIRMALRQVVSARTWLDGNGKVLLPDRQPNLLSMRGPWRAVKGDAKSAFDTWSQQLVFEHTSGPAVVAKTFSGDVTDVSWAKPSPDSRYRVECRAKLGARCRFVINKRGSDAILVDSGELDHGQTISFAWPAADASVTLYAHAEAIGAKVNMLMTAQ